MNAKVVSNNTLLEDMMGNLEMFVDFFNFHRLVIAGTLLEYRGWHKFCWIISANEHLIRPTIS